MINYQDIRNIHLELSSFCNARCPWCPRNFWGYPYNGGYPEVNLTLENVQHIFDKTFLEQLTSMDINGNFGDMIMNPESIDIIEYFRSMNRSLQINVSTNGSARNSNFWTNLASTGARVGFCLDGLEDTHQLYRQDTNWKTIINNAQTFINAGGFAIWKMIKFDHNLSQIDECQKLSKEMGFSKFAVIDDGRNVAPVFDKTGKLTHKLGNYNGETDFDTMIFKKKTDLVTLEDIIVDKIPTQEISCKIKKSKSIYISANGDVTPCCWTGLYPKTYGHGQYHQAVNLQLQPLIKNNNALEHPLEECINWFNQIEESWHKESFQDGRLVICNDVCGK